MTRYRSATTAPGAKPAASEESDKSRPIGLGEEAPERGAEAEAGRPGGTASPVAIWEMADTVSPQEGQNRAPSGTGERHAGHRTCDSIPLTGEE
jgi:hypothetical protein